MRTNQDHTTDSAHSAAAPRRQLRRAMIAAAAIAVVGATVGVAAVGSASPSAAQDHAGHGSQEMRPADQLAATLAAAPYQDVSVAEAAGWASTIDSLGASRTQRRAAWACTTSTRR